MWRQVTVAHLELVFGDAETATAPLDADHLDDRFGERIAEHRADD